MEKNITTLQSRASEMYRQYKMKDLPPSLQRNNLQYYYLGIYPSLSNMEYIEKIGYPRYPKEAKSLYIHIPFCSGICAFCSYFKIAIDKDNKFKVIQNYFKLLKKEALYHAERTDLNISYLYFGGGTPSLIPAEILNDFLDFMKINNFLDEKIYGSMELHPELFDDKKEALALLQVLKSHGIKRVSIGYQFINKDMLKEHGRRHQKDFFQGAMQLIKNEKMLVNVDLMYGIPQQSFHDWGLSLQEVIDHNPDSVSTYFAFSDKHTKMRQKIERGEMQILSTEEIQTQQIMAQIMLEAANFQELPSNFFSKIEGKPHEIRPMQLPSESISLTLGPGSYGFFDDCQFVNVFDLEEYENRINAKKSPIWRAYYFKGNLMMYRDLMFLFKNSLSIDVYKIINKYGYNPLDIEPFSQIFKTLFDKNLIEQKGEIIKLSPKGRLIADEIAFLFKIKGIKSKDIKDEDKIILEKYNFSPSYPDL